ncbi:MAG: glycosyltransferase 87 family protein [Actinophytocola sp.]|uniref:glycosyltransferase 87 family protein n=1 Tax=Actinophytocola sp. TaxID=1872138 RepID=UPI003C77A64D
MERTFRRALRLDLLFYGISLVFAAGNAVFSEFYGYRVWGNFATAGYLVAVALTAAQLVSRTDLSATSRWLWSRWTPVVVVALFAGVVPLLVLIFRRDPGFVWGQWPWSFPSQPEVWVVERSARLLMDNGTPYPDLGLLGRPPHPDDYTPYGPAMTVFGLPRALFGDGPFTDARVAFAVVTVLAIVLTLKVMGWPRVPVPAAQLAAVSPLTLLTMVVAGDDIPVIALIVLAAALAFRASPAWAGLVIAVVINMKLTALPALAVIAVAIIAARGRRAMLIFFGTVITTTAVLVIPVLSVDPQSFVEHVVLYPAGLGEAASPAASPLPGHLIAQLGPVGHAVSLALLALAAIAIAAWLVIRPPRDPADVMLRTAVGLGTAIILAPATRWGYLVYPLAMLGAMLGFSAAARREGRRTPAGPTDDDRLSPTDRVNCADDDPVANPDTRGIQA